MYNPWNKARAQSWYQQQPRAADLTTCRAPRLTGSKCGRQKVSIAVLSIRNSAGPASMAITSCEQIYRLPSGSMTVTGFERINLFLSIAHSHRMKVMLTLLDDCAFPVMSPLSVSKTAGSRHSQQPGSG